MLLDKTNYVDVPFFLTKNPYTNDINLTTGVNAIKQSIKNIILTIKGERRFNIEFGTNLTLESFQFDDAIQQYIFLDSIKNTILKYEPRIINPNVYIKDNKLVFDLQEKNKTQESVKTIQLTIIK
jgi:phage baseplate assembly protein W